MTILMTHEMKRADEEKLEKTQTLFVVEMKRQYTMTCNILSEASASVSLAAVAA